MKSTEAMVPNCSTSALSLVLHVCTETTLNDPVPDPSLDTLFGPISMTPYALNFQGEELPCILHFYLWHMTDLKSCRRKGEHLSSSPASS